MMRGNHNFETLFPMKDAASAQLMLEKAQQLFEAGVIGRAERQAVIELSLEFQTPQRPTNEP